MEIKPTLLADTQARQTILQRKVVKYSVCAAVPK